ncbi:NAD(P)H-dependent oxidoreductase [Arcanobacterium wilhelmae]|nr:NAD(P)H-dependent oxidoreductase [Arcanobacterium wilhelmae]WFN90222.1 NAD(P)H-dependent oxidoreductase [Arcanobacterium wilhelmae]
MVKVAVFVGSLRENSWNKKVANDLVSHLPEGYEAEFIEIGNVPFYNEDWDSEGNIPAEAAHLRTQAKEADALIFVTPEYNRSVPGMLKNALDVISRPPSAQLLKGKPAFIATASTGQYGAFGANHILRQTLMFMDVPVVAQPEVYLAKVDTLYIDGVLNQGTQDFLGKAIERFVKHVELHTK